MNNAVIHLQSFLTHNLPYALHDGVLLSVDDCLFHDETVDGVLLDLRAFFTFCQEFNWLVYPMKCDLFCLQARWCGRIIYPAGIRYHLSNLTGLLEMNCPTTGGQLQQFLCAIELLR